MPEQELIILYLGRILLRIFRNLLLEDRGMIIGLSGMQDAVLSL